MRILKPYRIDGDYLALPVFVLAKSDIDALDIAMLLAPHDFDKRADFAQCAVYIREKGITAPSKDVPGRKALQVYGPLSYDEVP